MIWVLSLSFEVFSDCTVGDPMSPIILNIVVNLVVQQWIPGVFGLGITHHRLGCELSERGVTFYNDNGGIIGVESG